MRHKDLTDPDLHEPKGFTTVPPPVSGLVYVTDGLGGGSLQAFSNAYTRTVMVERPLLVGTTTLLDYEMACYLVKLTGTPGGTPDVIVDDSMNPLWIWNTCGVTVEVKTAAIAGVSIADGKVALVFCDGTTTRRLTADTTP